jgi:8-oxo-dGTP diphosphatase
METGGEPSHELMDDVRAVDWLPLEAAVERLSRAYERAFLANVGPLALEAAALTRRSRTRKRPAPVKRRRRPTVAPQPPLTMPATITPPPELMPSPIEADLPLMVGNDLVEAQPVESQSVEAQSVEAQSAEAQSSGCATALWIAPHRRKTSPRWQQRNLNPRTRLRLQRAETGTSTWCRSCGTGCGAWLSPDRGGDASSVSA